MHSFGSPSVWLVAVGLSLAGIGNAAAQQSTTATYEDWVLQCRDAAGPPPQRVCDIAQVTQVQGKNVPLSRIAISRTAKTQPFTFTAQVPVNVSLRANLRVQVNASDPGVAVPFDRCLPAGCFAGIALNEEIIRRFLGATAAGKMTFKSANGRDVAIPISFKGFHQAFSALGKQ